MPKLKQVSGKDLIKFFELQGFEKKDQRGSHVKLRRIISGHKQTLIIPQHDEIRVGTMREILRQASHYISEQVLQEFFYTR
jgi:predicted RNA binding protein YcfA (HicA-like mRNA interferase family)